MLGGNTDFYWPDAIQFMSVSCVDLLMFERSDCFSMILVPQGLEEAAGKGLTKQIGTSNYSITKTDKLLETAKIVPAVNQVESHTTYSS